jgi:uncharacterized phage protein gp47/JayE
MAHIPTFDADGLTVLSLTQILENLKESVYNASSLGPTVSTGDHTVLGMHLEAAAIELSFCYDLLNDIYASGDIDSAEGVQQDNLNRMRGAVRNPARNSTAIVTCGGTNGTVIAAGSLVSIGGDGERWTTNVQVTIPVGLSIDAAVTAENTGAIEAAIGAIDTIVTTTPGWNTVTNAAAAVEGEAVESDADYRLRSEDTGTGTTTEEAIYTRLSEQDDIDAVVVVSNRTDTTDANGIPPHGFWVVVYPNTADQQNIAEVIWGEAGAPAGIEMKGAVTATVTDANGYEQQIKWDWATAVDVWISVVGTKDADYPAGGDDLVRDAIEALFAQVDVGANVNPAPIEGAVTTGDNSVPGIVSLDALMKIGGAPGGGDTSPLTIAINEYADLNATIGVTIT